MDDKAIEAIQLSLGMVPVGVAKTDHFKYPSIVEILQTWMLARFNENKVDIANLIKDYLDDYYAKQAWIETNVVTPLTNLRTDVGSIITILITHSGNLEDMLDILDPLVEDIRDDLLTYVNDFIDQIIDDFDNGETAVKRFFVRMLALFFQMIQNDGLRFKLLKEGELT